MMRTTSSGSKSFYMRSNIVFTVFFFLVYSIVVLSNWMPKDGGRNGVDCASVEGCYKGEEEGKGMADDEQEMLIMATAEEKANGTKKMVLPTFLQHTRRGARNIALVNIEADRWPGGEDNVEEVEFDRVPANRTWKSFFPEWIDEDEEYHPPSCPEMPMPDFGRYGEAEVVVVELPQAEAATSDGRDVFRLQVHLVAAAMAVMRGRRDGKGEVKLVFHSESRPMMEIFRCDDFVEGEGRWWMYRSETARLEQMVTLPVGTCKLALPWNKTAGSGGKLTLPTYDPPPSQRKREAYATVIHSSNKYICGAITLARSLLGTGTDRDLVLLHDSSIPALKLLALQAAGWKLRLIRRIRSPQAEKEAYNAYNYSKFRLWQLVAYSKVVFIDADVLVLRNMDVLFRMPQLSATYNNLIIFNSGVMVIEPSECTFLSLMSRRNEIVSYNGGDQGYLNEIFVWWHRLPRRVSFIKNFEPNTTRAVEKKESLIRSDPPELYAIHYLGMKPWTCYRDYDCNWNVDNQRVFASDSAHSLWWKVHDGMPQNLQCHCRLTSRRQSFLEDHRRTARAEMFPDRHWNRTISDDRPIIISSQIYS